MRIIQGAKLLQYGIQTDITPRPQVIETSTSSLVAIVGTTGADTKGLAYYDDIDEALKIHTSGTLLQGLKDLKAGGVKKVITSSFEIKQTNTYDLTKAKEAIAELAKAQNALGYRPKLIIAPDIEGDGVYEALLNTAESLRAVFFYQITATAANANTKIPVSAQNTRGMLSFQKVKREDGEPRALAPFLCAMYSAVLDSDFGFNISPSGQRLRGVISIVDYVDFSLFKESKAGELRALGWTLAVINKGVRSFGGETKGDLKELRSRVIFDTIIESILDAQADAIDKNVSDVLGELTDALQAFYRRLVSRNVLLDFKIELPRELNTKEELTAGHVYIRHTTQESPTVKKIINKIYLVDKFATRLLDKVN